MRTLEAIDRLNRLCPPEGAVTPEKSSEIRRFLSALRPLQIVNLFYSRRLSNRRPPVIASVRSRFKTKKELLHWIYGGNRVFQDTNYVRLPSLEKRVLVSRLTAFARKRYPWLSPRIIHAFAFRPDYFRDRSRVNGEFSWGPLYRRVEIPKGASGRRRLWIPSPPLRRVQRCLLQLSLNRALGELSPHVNGCRPRRSGDPPFGIFRNAAAHLGQEFVVTLDIANFFPSITVDDIVPALLNIQSSMVLKSPVATQPEGEAFGWTHDAAVLVARLVTHRGRLPQGAPTSPAIANLVFKPFDQQLVRALGGDFVYTRYVDDITVSVSKMAARRHGIASEGEMQRRAVDIINDVLDESPFELNPRKTRTTSLCTGHAVTGLRVTADVVDLPRKTKRRIRSLLYRIRKHGFLDTACDRVGGEVHSQTSLRVASKSSLRWKGARGCSRNDHVREGRRLSTERLAVLMLRKLYPDLKIEVPSKVFDFDGARITRPLVLHEGKPAWRDIEKFLPLLWENDLYAEDEDGHTAIKSGNGERLCRMRAERQLAFFHLAKRQAICAVEFWHQLRGLAAGISIKDNDRCFQPIKGVQTSIAQALCGLQIKVPSAPGRPVARPVQSVDRVNLIPFDETVDAANKVFELANDMHLPICGRQPSAEWIQQSMVFRKPVGCAQELHQWLRATDIMLNGTFPRLPIPRSKRPESMAATIFRAVRVLHERMACERFPTYELERKYLKNARLPRNRIEDIQDSVVSELWRVIVKRLRDVFEESDELRQQAAREGDWPATLAENDLTGFDKRLTAETERFVELREKAVWPDDGRRVFSEDVNSQLAEQADQLARPITKGLWKHVWKELFEFGRNLICYTTESMVYQQQAGMEERFNKLLDIRHPADFNVIRQLRHRAAHGVSYRGLKQEDQDRIHREWLTTQGWAKRCLGRVWSWRQEDSRPRTVFFDDERDLHIKPLEGTEVKLALLRSVNQALEKFRRPKS